MIYAFVFFACFQRGLSFVLMSRPVDPALLIPIDIVEEFPVSCWKSSKRAASSAIKRLLQCVGHKIVAEILATQDAINLFPKLFSPLIPGQNTKGKLSSKYESFINMSSAHLDDNFTINPNLRLKVISLIRLCVEQKLFIKAKPFHITSSLKRLCIWTNLQRLC